METFDVENCISLNAGGTKTAFAVNDFLVVMQPNLQDGEALIEQWPAIVQEELMVSNLLSQLSISHLQLTPCMVKFNYRQCDYLLPSYTSCQFAFLQKHGILIIESNSYVLPSIKESIKTLVLPTIDEWVDKIQPLLSDLEKIMTFQVPYTADSMNLAIFTTRDSHIQEVRLFGFDFSIKYHRQKIDSLILTLYKRDAYFYDIFLKRRLSTLFRAFPLTWKEQDELVDKIIKLLPK